MTLPTAAPQRREIQNVIDPVPILDTARFEHMQRIAKVMASSSMIPETLRTFGQKDNKQDLPFEQVLSNCFLVVNQAARWGMDPFAVISCCAVVHGRLSYEGKLVSAVLAAKLGVQLHHHFTGDPATDGFRIYILDRPFTDDVIGLLKPGVSIPGLRLWDGSVGEWKTAGAGTPWTPKNYKRMLIYRGARDWTRVYEPAILLGVYTDDELEDLAEDARSRRATPVLSLSERLAAAKQPGSAAGDGFSQEHVVRETTQESTTSKGGANQNHGDTDTNPPAGEIAGQAGEAPATELSSTEASGEATVDAPAAEVSPAPHDAAGQQIQESSGMSQHTDDGSEGAGLTLPGSAGPSLPQGTLILYVNALRRAQKKESLAKYAKQFWDDHGGWDAHKATPDGETAAAIFNAFRDHFGDKDAIDLELREII